MKLITETRDGLMEIIPVDTFFCKTKEYECFYIDQMEQNTCGFNCIEAKKVLGTNCIRIPYRYDEEKDEIELLHRHMELMAPYYKNRQKPISI